ncbi:MAG: DNA polymerase III subunit gamma/tau [Bacteroidota bacterium]|nr:DNA polymerase III subunit gamma/tau [Bacteroidota bacterium]
MEDFIVSARKYRPATFRTVVGQYALTTTLKNAVITKKLAHAFLFCGPRGVGKTTCARIFAKTINCFTPTAEGEACNQCESCVSFNEQRSYNIHELDAASNNSVDDIRLLIEQVRIPPQIGQYKVYIIDEVHMLSQSAFNAFLKTLEEPPKHAIFVLATTEKHKILPTILSRCQIYDFNRISINDIVEHLQYVASQESVTAEPEALNVIAQKADGGMRDALSIFDQVVSFTGGNITYRATIDNLNVLDYDYYFRLVEAFLSGNVIDAMLIFNEVLNRGFEGQNFISGMSSHLRDLLVAKDPQTLPLLEVGEAIGVKYTQQAQKCQNAFLYKALEISNECDLNYRLSKNKRLLVELTLIRLCQILQPVQPQPVQRDIQPIAANPVPQPVQQPAQAQHPQARHLSSAPVQTLTVAPPPQVTAPPPPPPAFAKTQTPAPPAPKSAGQSMRMPGLSIKNGFNKKDDSAGLNQQSGPSVSLNTPFDNEALILAWNEYAQSLTVENILVQKTMQTARPLLKENYQFEVAVDGPQQVEILEQDATTMVTYLKNKLKNTSIQMHIRVNEVNERPKASSMQEKLKAMMNTNPELIKLKEIFDLEIA